MGIEGQIALDQFFAQFMKPGAGVDLAAHAKNVEGTVGCCWQPGPRYEHHRQRRVPSTFTKPVAAFLRSYLLDPGSARA